MLLTVLFASAQVSHDRAKASEYPQHTRAGEAEVGVEYMVRSISVENMTFTAEGYLVIDVGVFPMAAAEVMVAISNFQLRLNGKKDLLMPQTPGIVAASMKYPDWTRRPQLEAGAGPVIIGRPRQVERFPGDNRPAASRLPGPIPRAPAGVDKPVAEPLDLPALVARAALPEGPTRKPVHGYVYYACSTKLEKIKSVELVLTMGSGEPVTLRLR